MNEPTLEITPPEESAFSSAVIGSVPRISIQVFCQHPDTATTIDSASKDRRLSRAHTNIQMGGAAAAVEHYGVAPTPNLLIVECTGTREAVLAELGQLAQVCDAGTKVVVIGHLNDVILYRELMREGVSEYIVAPISQLQIIESISNLYNDPDAAPVGRVLAFCGTRGGCGSSTLAHNVGWAISEHIDENVVIMDLDLPFGTAGLNFNQDPPQGLAEALSSPDRMDDVLLDRLLTRCSDRLSLFAAPGAVDREYEFDGEALDSIVEVVRHNVPTVVIDVPHVWTPWAKKVLIGADEIIITAVPELASLRNAKNLIDVAKAARPNDFEPRLVLNQVGVPKRPEIAPHDFTRALELEPSLIIPYDPQLFGTAANNGQMIEEVQEASKVAEGIRHLASLLSGRVEQQKPAKSFFGPLLGKLSFKKEAS
jgi:pilus assembly protein CpaE